MYSFKFSNNELKITTYNNDMLTQLNYLNYKCIKSVFEYEHYLNVLNVEKYCVALHRFRCGNLKLPIWSGPPHGLPGG